MCPQPCRHPGRLNYTFDGPGEMASPAAARRGSNDALRVAWTFPYTFSLDLAPELDSPPAACGTSPCGWLKHISNSAGLKRLVIFCPRLPCLGQWRQHPPSCTSQELPESFLMSVLSSSSCKTSARPARSITKTHPEPTQLRPPPRPPPWSKDLEPAILQRPPTSLVACRCFLHS